MAPTNDERLLDEEDHRTAVVKSLANLMRLQAENAAILMMAQSHVVPLKPETIARLQAQADQLQNTIFATLNGLLTRS